MLLLQALPEETLYSRCVRTREVYGMTANQFFSVFFKNKTHSVHPYLNTLLNVLSEKTIESGQELWTRQTLLPLYAWAMPDYRKQLEDLAISAMNLHTLCKLSTYAENHPAPLKHCPVCTYQDVRHFGVAYWHRQHQIAGVTACNHHKVRLNSIVYPRLSGINSHGLLHQRQRLSLSSEDDYRFATFSSQILELICSSSPEFISNCHSSLVKRFIKSVLSKDPTDELDISVFKKLYDIAERLDHSSKNLFPSIKNNISYWKTLLYGSSQQSPTQYLLLLYCLNQFDLV
ncbi:TniQ family protein [Enterobacter mori]|uniref:TniQ family protein n=1 Tax=Enterobacter mori TaxID=539813 RepID=UPI000908012E|nr:TniQ family protein [Enterobacter mori]